MKYNNSKITSCKEEMLLGILLDNKLNFKSQITPLLYLISDKEILLLNLEVKSQFSYGPLIRMFTSPYLNDSLGQRSCKGSTSALQ